MRAGRHHWLTRLYPAAWRDRYGEEFDALIEEEGVRWYWVMDVTKAALTERIRPSAAGVKGMQTNPGTVAALVRKPSALIPIAMSIAALAVVLAPVAAFGVRREPDEGAAAHIFQILITCQIPFLAWFALDWLGRDPKGAGLVIGLQIAAVAIALFPVWYFGF